MCKGPEARGSPEVQGVLSGRKQGTNMFQERKMEVGGSRIWNYSVDLVEEFKLHPEAMRGDCTVLSGEETGYNLCFRKTVGEI